MTERFFPDPPAELHFVGIKGQGMAALAQILKAQGYIVVGSDTAEVFPTDATLRRLNIRCFEKFAEVNVSSDADAIIYSTAYDEQHPERQAAKKLGIPEWSYPEAVGMLFQTYRNSVSVAGSHGKTTTTAMLTNIFIEAGLDPTAIVGSTVPAWGGNARVGSSEWFVFETDEYQNKFAHYSPRFVLLTNIDFDHPDFFKDRVSYEDTFLRFAEKTPKDGVVVMCGDDPMRLSLQSVVTCPFITYGEDSENDWQLRDVRIDQAGTTFRVLHKGKDQGTFSTLFAGKHYALDALGAMAMATHCGVSIEAIGKGIQRFRGTARRLEEKGVCQGALVIDDFAHHPTEIKATLIGLRARFPEERLVVLFHPHTFSRTAAFLDEFALALSLADVVYLLPVYGSAREVQGRVGSEDIASRIVALGREAKIVPNVTEAIKTIRGVARKGDVVITMGAGDGWLVADGLVA